MNRRDAVIAGVSAAGLLPWARAATASPAGKSEVFGVLIDRRFAEAEEFGRAAAWRGHTIFAYQGDLTATWLHELEPRWSRRAGALAGMTTPAGLFCLEQLAAQHWLRTVSRTEHRRDTGPTLISWVISS